MGSDTITVLVIEDNRGDFELIRQMFGELKEASFGIQWAKKLKPSLQFLSDNKVDVILLDLDLPDSKGLATLDQVLVHAPGTPVVVLTGFEDEATAVQAVEKGAQDYLIKGALDAPTLGRAVRYAIQRQEMRTQLKQYAQNLHGSNMRLMKILEQDADGTVIVNREGRTVFMNSMAEKLIGRPRAKLLGRPNELPLDSEANEFLLPRDSGDPVSLDLRVVEVDWEGDRASLISLRQTSERSRTDEITGQSAREWQEIFDAVTEMIFLLDKEHRIIRANRTVRKWMEDKPVQGLRLEDLFDDAKSISACLRQVNRHGEVERCELQADDPEGNIPRMAAYPINNEAGKVDRIVAIISEGFENAKEKAVAQARETARHEAVVQRVEAKQEDLAQLKTQFSRVVYQELSEPLSAMASSTDRLQDLLGESLTTRQKAYLQVLRKHTARLSRFASSVATVSNEDGHTMRPRVMPVIQALQPVLDLQEKLAQEAQISVEILMDDSDDDAELMVCADPEAVTQVINHLLTNVIMHCPKGTNVTISNRYVKFDNAMEICVADDGPGIPSEELEKVFEPFYRGVETPGKIQRGSGLGLTLCRSLVEGMGGKIRAESTPGGASIKFTLPASTTTAEVLFGKIALLMGYITSEQIQEVVAVQTSSIKREHKIGELLIDRGYLTLENAERILEEQQVYLSMPHPRLPNKLSEALLGSMALRYGYLSEEQLHECLCIHEVLKDDGHTTRLGEILVKRQLMTAEDVASLLRMQKLQIKCCPRCSSKFNAKLSELEKLEACPKCGAPLAAEKSMDSITVDGDLD